jgi:hypothetical protein
MDLEARIRTLCLTLAVIGLVLPFVLYYLLHGGRGPEWGMVSAGEGPVGEGAYRRTHDRLWKRGEAPRLVRVAALSSFFLGEMIVPGLLAAGMLGLYIVFRGIGEATPEPMVSVLVLAAPTGLLVAGFVLKAGHDLLSRSPKADDSASRAATWAIRHNLALLLGLLWAANEPADRPGLVIPPLPFVVYACVSIAHAILLRSAVSALTEYTAAQERDHRGAGAAA